MTGRNEGESANPASSVWQTCRSSEGVRRLAGPTLELFGTHACSDAFLFCKGNGSSSEQLSSLRPPRNRAWMLNEGLLPPSAASLVTAKHYCFIQAAAAEQ